MYERLAWGPLPRTPLLVARPFNPLLSCKRETGQETLSTVISLLRSFLSGSMPLSQAEPVPLTPLPTDVHLSLQLTYASILPSKSFCTQYHDLYKAAQPNSGEARIASLPPFCAFY